jgi:CRISPR-associated protein Cas2
MEIMLIIVAYDIPNNKRRRKVFRCLKDFGDPRLRSVFECWVTPAALTRLQRELAWLLRFNEDSVRCYFLCEHCEKQVAAHERRPPGQRESVIL